MVCAHHRHRTVGIPPGLLGEYHVNNPNSLSRNWPPGFDEAPTGFDESGKSKISTIELPKLKFKLQQDLYFTYKKGNQSKDKTFN